MSILCGLDRQDSEEVYYWKRDMGITIFMSRNIETFTTLRGPHHLECRGVTYVYRRLLVESALTRPFST